MAEHSPTQIIYYTVSKKGSCRRNSSYEKRAKKAIQIFNIFFKKTILVLIEFPVFDPKVRFSFTNYLFSHENFECEKLFDTFHFIMVNLA